MNGQQNKLLSLVLMVLVLLLIPCCNDKPKRVETSIRVSEGTGIIQILVGEGDGGSNVVNFYFKKNNDVWRWYYVSHESTSRNWSVACPSGSNMILINDNHEAVYRFDPSTGKYYKGEYLWAKEGFVLIGEPSDQDYPVKKIVPVDRVTK
jgi:hypothetical protein